MNPLVIIPTYNERENIERMLHAVLAAYPEVRILVVDDNSPDGTGRIVEQLAATDPRVRLLSRPGKEGLGKAYRAGFLYALQDSSVDSIGMMDADFSHDPSMLPAMMNALSEIDVAVGSRYVPGGMTQGWELWRRLLSSGGNRYARTITRLPVRDCTSGFVCIRTDQLRKVNLDAMDASGYAFQIELKYLLWKSGARFREIPILFRNREGGESKISNHIIREGLLAPWKMIRKM